MNCDDITSILNSHGTDSLDAPRRAAVDAHLETCCECRGTWLVADALRREQRPSAPHGLLARIVDGLDGVDRLDGGDGRGGMPDAMPSKRTAEAPRRVTQWAAPGALLAASIAVAVGIGVWQGTEGTGSESAPPSASSRAPESRSAANDEPAAPARDEGPGALLSGERSGTRPSDVRGTPDEIFEPGRDYRLVANALPPTARASGPDASENRSLAGATPIRVEVVQFFMYGCRPCYAFEPQVDGWETKADYVELLRVPVVFNAAAELHARAFYTAEALGKRDEMHTVLFREIHERGNPIDSAASIADLFAQLGIDDDAFLRAYRSPEIDAKVEAAIELARAFGVTATPSLVVGRRYLTSPAMTGSFEATFAVVDELAASMYEVSRNDRCAPVESVQEPRRGEELLADDSPAERRAETDGAETDGAEADGAEADGAEADGAEAGGAEAGGPATMQRLIDLVSQGCPGDDIF